MRNYHLVTRVCYQCSIEFDKPLFSKQKFCCHECYKKSRMAKKPDDVVCGVCSELFSIKRNVPAKYCSDKCRSLARYRKLTNYPIKSPRIRSEYGNGYINKLGYRVIYREHPNANKRTKIILEHIFIKSQELGRPMRKGETVHHINGIRSDNRVENLELFTSRHPSGVRHEDKLKSAIAFLEEEGYKLSK